MESEEVLQDFPPGTTLNCVTEHPGFNTVCLQKWSLKQSARQYKTKSNRRYKQSVESEERYVVIQHDLEESFQKMPPYNLLYVRLRGTALVKGFDNVPCERKNVYLEKHHYLLKKELSCVHSEH
jgi:hypothetical protein